MPELWIIGRVLDDGTRQTYSNDDGTMRTFASEDEANHVIATELQHAGNVFAFSVDTSKVTLLPTAGHA